MRKIKGWRYGWNEFGSFHADWRIISWIADIINKTPPTDPVEMYYKHKERWNK